ncbi:protein suppressor of sable isoform X1 [Phthorimaea operculella]|nr:protein suppressor of sable isoform X1 [Phthorimaea operculella]
MLIVSTNISESFMMAEPTAEPAVNADEDLEDGEIESDGEEIVEAKNESKTDENPPEPENKQLEEVQLQEQYFPKSGKKKKSKSKGDQKFKDKNKKNRKYSAIQNNDQNEDDFASNIEKAIRKAMNKNDDKDAHNDDGGEERRRHKKRKKYDNRDGPGKKRKKPEYSDEMDESEMMCVRGASPVQRNSPAEMYPDDDKESYASDSSNESRNRDQHHRQQRNRQQRDRNNKKNSNDWRRGAHPMQDPDGVCLYFMQGKCHKGDDCIYSHDAQPPRKMELCKFYLMDCCAKRDKCLYMHADFPCKYYHTGLPCIYKDECKFAHGKPLTENLKNILLKHIESAPKEILGDFPRLNREGALKMIHTTQTKLMQQFPDPDRQEKTLPSLFDLNVPNPQNSHDNSQIQQFGNDKQPKVSSKVRQSRWQNDSSSNQNFNINLSPGGNASSTNVLSIKNLTGVLTPRQISDLSKMGIETLDQLGQLTVLQLNSIGISLKQITEIQMNTMSIQKLGLINTNSEQQPPPLLPQITESKDLDLRVPPPAFTIANAPVPSGLPGQDIDMRFQPAIKRSGNEDSSSRKVNDPPSKDMIDIDQYTKDALKFACKDKENIDISNDTIDNESKPLPNEIKDVDHRVLPFSSEDTKQPDNVPLVSHIKKECDTDIRFLRPEPIFRSPEKRHRRSTTDDDEESNLLIDEKWYSSDEEKGTKKKSPGSSPLPASMSPQQPTPPVIEPSSFLSKIEPSAPSKSRDPRSKRSPGKSTEKSADTSKVLNKRVPRVSIYECIEGEPTDGRRRSDVDLRKSDFPGFGDTDLRQASTTSGDIDLRLGLPFKAIPNYTPASEIDGSINSHPPIPFKLIPIDIPRPDYTDIRNSTAKSQALLDPRLRKVFRLSVDESNSDSEKPSSKPVSTGPRIDPRRKQTETVETSSQDQKSNSLDLQTVLQNSNWFKDLSSTQKISVNQYLMPVMQMIKQYQQEKSSGKKFDSLAIQNNTVLCGIFTNLGVSLGENGEFSYLPKPKEALLKTPINFSPTGNPFGMSGGVMDANSINMMSMPPMNMGNVGGMNVGPMHGYNQAMPDLRGGPTPGLLGIAPNIPHNFNAFGPNNFANNMGFNGPNTGNNFMDGDPNYQRFPNRGGPRGRGNERWNRGGSGRGNRDRKNFNDRGNWKNERH